MTPSLSDLVTRAFRDAGLLRERVTDVFRAGGFLGPETGEVTIDDAAGYGGGGYGVGPYGGADGDVSDDPEGFGEAGFGEGGFGK